jgi:hypothetical protein
MKPDNIKPMDIYGLMYKMSKKYGKISANAGKTILQNVLNECVRWGLIERNPCKEVKSRAIKDRKRRT